MRTPFKLAVVGVAAITLTGCSAAKASAPKPTATADVEQATTIENVWNLTACNTPDALADASNDTKLPGERRSGHCNPGGGGGSLFLYEFDTHKDAVAGVQGLESAGNDIYVFENVVILTNDATVTQCLGQKFDQVQ